MPIYSLPQMASLNDHDVERLRNMAGLRLISIDLLHTHAARSFATAPENREATQRWCRRMESLGLLTISTVVAAVPGATEPVLRFIPGDDAPNFGAVARALRSRAEAATQERTEVVRLTTHGAAVLGVGLPRASRRCELSHDLRLARFVLELRCGPAPISWIPEDQLAKRRTYDHVVPDGELLLHTGETIVVECGGTYSKTKLASFHARLVPQLERRGACGYIII